MKQLHKPVDFFETVIKEVSTFHLMEEIMLNWGVFYAKQTNLVRVHVSVFICNNNNKEFIQLFHWPKQSPVSALPVGPENWPIIQGCTQKK